MGCFCSDAQIILRICKEVPSLAHFKQQSRWKVKHLGKDTSLARGFDAIYVVVFLRALNIRSQMIVNDSQSCASCSITLGRECFSLLSGLRWGTRQIWRGAECYRRATVATSPSSSGQSSPRHPLGWDTTLMNCSWEL